MIIPTRYFSSSGYLCKHIPVNLKGRGKSSQDWLIRQLKDPYVEKAKIENYRCRSAFKLLEIDDKHSLLSPGLRIIDLGAAPGGWSQVAASRVNAHGKDLNIPTGFVLSVDRQPIQPIDGAIILGGYDFTKDKSVAKILEILQGVAVDVVLSDMAPNASGIKHSDHDSILMLAYSVVRFSFETTREGGALLVKLWDGGGTSKLVSDLLQFYKTVKRIKPPASRSDSTEIFILAKGFKGALKNT